MPFQTQKPAPGFSFGPKRNKVVFRMPSFAVSPSRVSRFFFHECERYLRYHATPRKMRKEAGITAIPWDTSPVAAAILEGGYVWEEKVIQDKLKGRIKISAGDGPCTNGFTISIVNFLASILNISNRTGSAARYS